VTFWVDANLTPHLAPWLAERFGLTVFAVRDLGLLYADDPVIFETAHAEGIVIITKDRDMAERVTRLGPPPQILWITCGNTSNARLRHILEAALAGALTLLEQGEPLVEISDAG